ncbi:MAG: class I adenylate-forming enzyme family protein [Blastopirellula sp. JB062]
MTDESTRLQNLLHFALAKKPGAIAIRNAQSAISYAELDRQVRQVAAGLRRLGIESGDRVAWLLPNCLEAVLVTLACYQIGAVAVPLNYRYVPEEARDVLQRTGAKAIVFHADRAQLTQALSDLEQLELVIAVGGAWTDAVEFSELYEAGEMESPAPTPPDAPALILFTSGSTGRPKGVVHSQDGVFQAIDQSRRLFHFDANDVVLIGKPISHAGGLQTQLMAALSAGGETILAMKPQPDEAIDLIKAYGVTEYGLLASDLLDFIERLERHPTELPSLKNAIGSGDSVPTDLHHRFRDLVGWEVMEGAGMTEAGCYYAANPRFGKRKWGSLGVAAPGAALKIVNSQGVACAVGEVGEIVLQMPSATIGYWNDPSATDELYRDGWLHTGDLARQDEEGYVWFVGRKKLMIVRRGSNIAPAEVENVIDEHPAVHASAVVGVSDARDGSVPVACVALNAGEDQSREEEIRRDVAERLAAYKNPTHYLFLNELPRNATGKLDRHRLQQLAERQFGGA